MKREEPFYNCPPRVGTCLQSPTVSQATIEDCKIGEAIIIVVIIVTVVIICLASCPNVLSLATGRCEPSVVTYTTPSPEPNNSLSGPCDKRRANEQPSLWFMRA